jgi:hypothetical protein
MKKPLLILCLFTSSISYAQSNLPPCNGNFSGPCFGSRDYSHGQYIGQFKDDKINGQGTFAHASGDKYEGQFKDDKYDGQGTFIFANGKKYVGQLKDGKKHGQGTLIWTNGDKYEGQFKDDKYDGQGTFTFANGTKYVGQWKDGKYDGQGTFYNVKGSIYKQGLWSDNKFITANAEPSFIEQIKTISLKDLLSGAAWLGLLIPVLYGIRIQRKTNKDLEKDIKKIKNINVEIIKSHYALNQLKVHLINKIVELEKNNQVTVSPWQVKIHAYKELREVNEFSTPLTDKAIEQIEKRIENII